MIILYNMMQQVVIHHRTVELQYSAGPRTIAKCFWSTPKTLSTSSLAVSWHWAKWMFCYLWALNCFDQGGPLWIDAIRKLVTYRVVVSIDRAVASMSFTRNKPRKQWWSWQHIQIIVRARHTKEWMQYPEIMWCSCLKNDCWIIHVAFVPTLPPYMIIFSSSMHTIKWSKHPRPSSCFIQSSVSRCLPRLVLSSTPGQRQWSLL